MAALGNTSGGPVERQVMSAVVITPALLKLKKAQEQQLRDDAEADRRDAEYEALPALCKCGGKDWDLQQIGGKNEDGFVQYMCLRCGNDEHWG